jgi:hypothetical protein
MSKQFDYQSYGGKSWDSDPEEKLDGVSCEVKSCKYHAPGGVCQAQNITVEAPDASKKVETYCGTYAPNGNPSNWAF